MPHRPHRRARLAMVVLGWFTPAVALAGDGGVPLSRLDGGLWTVPAIVASDTAPLRLVLDTGAERTVLDTRVARGLGLEPAPWGLLGTPAGVVEAAMVRLPSLALGTHVRHDVAVLVADLSALAVGSGVDGILGMDALTAPHLVIDFAGGVLSFDIADRRTGVEETVLPMRANGVRLVVDVQLDGRPRPLVLDTGAETIVLFEPPGDDGPTVSFGSAGGRGLGRLSAVDVAVGALRLGSLPVLRVVSARPRFGSDGVLPATAFARIHIDREAGVVHVGAAVGGSRAWARASR